MCCWVANIIATILIHSTRFNCCKTNYTLNHIASERNQIDKNIAILFQQYFARWNKKHGSLFLLIQDLNKLRSLIHSICFVSAPFPSWPFNRTDEVEGEKVETVCAPTVFRARTERGNRVARRRVGGESSTGKSVPGRLLLELATKTAVELVPSSAMSRSLKRERRKNFSRIVVG